MAYSEVLAGRIRRVLARRRGITEKRMFGGLAFLAGGHMLCGVIEQRLMVRVGPEAYENALARPHVRKMDFTGKPLTGYVYVEPRGFASEEDLRGWVDSALAFVRALPAK